jgi:hypothetical protein
MRSSNRLSIFGSERQTKWICWAQFKSIIDSWCAVKPVAPLNREFLKRKEIGENTDMTMLRLCPLVLLRQLHQRTTKSVPRLVLCDWMRLSRLRAQKPECGRGGPSCPSQSLATCNTLWKRRPAVGPYFGCCGNERTETWFFQTLTSSACDSHDEYGRPQRVGYLWCSNATALRILCIWVSDVWEKLWSLFSTGITLGRKFLEILTHSQVVKIKIETLVSVLLLCLAVVLNSVDMKPVKWREWASKQERENTR